MHKIALFVTMLLISCMSIANLPTTSSIVLTDSNKEHKKKLIGYPVYIQIFKEEHLLNLYIKIFETYQLFNSYKICNYSGGLGPKRCYGDFKSPEGFYIIRRQQLKFNSFFHKAINIGFPNDYDRAHGYNGKYLMIHGACVSVGCYAMTNKSIDEIFQFVNNALIFGQPYIQLSIYPFQMTDSNMQLHKYSCYTDFWKQLKPGYEYFQQMHRPPIVSVVNGNYIVSKIPRYKKFNHRYY